MARVRVYVDGFNLYYRGLKGTPYKWLDPVALSQSLLDHDDQIDCLRYFTARVSPRAGDLDAPRRQELYLKALRTRPEVRIHFGRFLPKTKTRPLVRDPTIFVEVHDTEEKGSDVNLASHLLHDGWLGLYDVALVLSQDSDLCEPLRLVRDELRKPVGIVWLDGNQPGQRFSKVTSFIRHVTPSRLAAAQFPGRILGRDGRPVVKPPEW